MLRLIATELLKLRKRSLTWILLGILIGILVLLYLLLLAISKVSFPADPGNRQMDNMQNLLGLPMAIPFTLSILSSFGTVLAVILTANTVGSEYNWRTLRTMLISSESRSKLLLAKLIAVTTYVLLGMAIGVATGFTMSLISNAAGGYSLDLSFYSSRYIWDQFIQFWRTFFVLIPYMSLGFLFAINGRSAMPGVSLGLGVYFLESIVTAFMALAGGWIARVPDYLLTANVNAITALNKLPEGFRSGMGVGNTSSHPPTIVHASIVITAYSLVFIILAFYLFRTRDVTA